jgi:cobalt-zinc-cadmium efflux system outer membrane protein
MIVHCRSIALAIALGAAILGCRTSPKYRFAATTPGAAAVDSDQASRATAGVSSPLITPVAWQSSSDETIPAPAAANEQQAPHPPSEGTQLANAPAELDVNWLVAEVLARNPDIRSAVAAWRAAAQRYPQEIALDDPMFGYMLGPGSWGDPTVSSAYAVQASQKLPWPGKRDLRGNMAQAQANAKYFDVGEERLRIAEAARMAFYDYFMANRQLAVLDDSGKLLKSFREVATSRYEAAQVEQQDVLLAEVELAQLERRRLELNRQVRVAQARINTLLLVPADAPLPAPPADLPLRASVPSADELRSLALSQRPELAAQEARIRAERYSWQLACKEYYPDVEVLARYDTFWQEAPLRSMVGMNLNMPLYKEKRRAAAAEARARLAREQATLDARVAEISFEAEQARQQVLESQQSLAVYQKSLLPAAQQSIESARASYMNGRLDFLRLVESQRQLLSLREEYFAKLAEYHQRLAALDRALGSPPQAASP